MPFEKFLNYSILNHFCVLQPENMAFLSARSRSHMRLRDLDYEVPKQKQSAPISEIFRIILKDYEQKSPSSINIPRISKEYNVQHRRVYDFFNFLSSIGVCVGKEKKKISWVGIKKAKPYFINAYTQLETTIGDDPIDYLFNLGPSPSLGKIAVHFINLYFYLGVTKLSMRAATILLKDDSTDIKSLERRLYLVLSFLEIIGVITHTEKRCEYEININVDQVVYDAFQKKIKNIGEVDPTSIMTLLNRAPECKIQEILQKRKNAFQKYVSK